MILRNEWLTRFAQAKIPLCPKLQENVSCDVVVIGGGIAGLHAAQRISISGLRVVLIDKSICGASSSGKSSGFLTPESELGLSELIRRHGPKNAREVWEIATKGVSMIVNNIKKYNIKCDFQKQDSLYLGIGERGVKNVKEQALARKKLGYSYKLYSFDELQKIHPTKDYSSAIQYPKSYSFISLLYVQELKKLLLKKGVRIYENTEATQIIGNIIKTPLGLIEAKKIIVCIDKMKKSFSYASKNTYHAQTYLAISHTLTKRDIKKLFPHRYFMCWDSMLIYSYYRITKDNCLLLGGGSLSTIYSPTVVKSPAVILNVIKKFKNHFPHLSHVKFKSYWPGLVDLTQDIMPVVDYDLNNPHIQYVQGCPGLPWAAFCGDYAASRIINHKYKDYDKYFGANRKFPIPFGVQSIIGKPLTYAITNPYAKYYQKDTL